MFGMIIGGLLGGSALYFLGTEKGRKQLRNILDTIEDLDESTLKELEEKGKEMLDEAKNPFESSSIHSVLDKIQSSLPSKKEVKKYFEKDGKEMK